MSLSRRLLLPAVSSIALMAGAALPAVALALPATVTQGQQAQPSKPWAQDASDLKTDERIRFGTLPNGMRYALMHNATPPGQASFRLRIDAGSLHEDDDQKGLAHFSEHMLFNGTENVPENEMLRILERLGLAFGADTNAFTSFDQTAYMLELPRTDDETVDTSLMIMREQVSRALMEPSAIDAERDVIVGEARLRDSPQLRALKTQIALLAPGQRLADRLPIGDLDIIRTAPTQRFVDFYRSYYRPERATFIAVGDFDVDAMEAKVKAKFADWTNSHPNGPNPDLGTLAPREAESRIVVEPGVQSSVDLYWTRPADLRPDSVALRREDTIQSLGLAVLNRRLGELSRQDNPPFIDAGGGTGSFFQSLDFATISANFNPGGLARALETIEQEQRRLIQYGVSETELQREIANIRVRMENAVKAASTQPTPALAMNILGGVNENEVTTSPADNLARFNAAVEGLTPDMVKAELPKAFQGQGPLALVSTPQAIEGGEAEVTRILEASRAKPVEAPAVQAALVWPYTEFGTLGTASGQTAYAALGATVVNFPNGVRLTVKPTDFKDQEILVSVSTGNGQLGLPTDSYSPVSMAGNVFTAGGLGKLTADEVSRVLTGRIYSSGFSVTDETYRLSGSTRPEDLNLQLQVLTAYLTDPGLRAAPFEQIKAILPQVLEQQRATAMGAFGIDGAPLMAGGDRRVSMPTPAEINAMSITDVRAGVMAGLANGPIDIVVVGDTTVEDATKAVAATLAALPVRSATPAQLAGSDKRTFP
ncbi:M16 family metallopeptidase, partial [Brevundimonas sp.]|uniref:M16 family metallopeptidase n=1 Tax=Brevundimonas sp. TaxID=1871086 RepID=UPI002FC6ADA5